jgi:hypothetical protein
MRHGNIAHVVDICEIGSALASLLSTNVGNEQVAGVQIV